MEENKVDQEQDTDPDVPQRQFPTWKPMRRKFSADNPFFYAGNLDRELATKQLSLEITDEEKIIMNCLEEEQTFQNMFCPIAGCRSKLKSLAEFESHHVQRHMSKCSVCSKVFPSTRLLNLHVSETHDSFFQAKVARGFPMFECFVEGCLKRFQSDAGRLQHLVDLHQFPRSFSFRPKKHLSQAQRQHHKQNAYKQAPEHLLSTRKKPLSSKFVSKLSEEGGILSVNPDEDMTKGCQDVDQGLDPVAYHEQSGLGNDLDMDTITAGVSRLSTASQTTGDMPVVVSFGRRRARGSARQ